MAKAKTNESSAPMDSSPELPRIYAVRKQKVMLDSDLAALFRVETKVYNQAVRRNAAKFPSDFAFQLTAEEVERMKSQNATSSQALRSQIVTLGKSLRGKHSKYLPWVFTEHGAIMAAMVLRSEHAVAMSVFVVRAFVQMREQISSNLGVLKRLGFVASRVGRDRWARRDGVRRSQRSRPTLPQRSYFSLPILPLSAPICVIRG